MGQEVRTVLVEPFRKKVLPLSKGVRLLAAGVVTISILSFHFLRVK
jgi:hypothetical protein